MILLMNMIRIHSTQTLNPKPIIIIMNMVRSSTKPGSISAGTKTVRTTNVSSSLRSYARLSLACSEVSRGVLGLG